VTKFVVDPFGNIMYTHYVHIQFFYLILMIEQMFLGCKYIWENQKSKVSRIFIRFFLLTDYIFQKRGLIFYYCLSDFQ
jgi:hypothetical protein